MRLSYSNKELVIDVDYKELDPKDLKFIASKAAYEINTEEPITSYTSINVTIVIRYVGVTFESDEISILLDLIFYIKESVNNIFNYLDIKSHSFILGITDITNESYLNLNNLLSSHQIDNPLFIYIYISNIDIKTLSTYKHWSIKQLTFVDCTFNDSLVSDIRRFCITYPLDYEGNFEIINCKFILCHTDELYIRPDFNNIEITDCALLNRSLDNNNTEDNKGDSKVIKIFIDSNEGDSIYIDKFKYIDNQYFSFIDLRIRTCSTLYLSEINLYDLSLLNSVKDRFVYKSSIINAINIDRNKQIEIPVIDLQNVQLFSKDKNKLAKDILTALFKVNSLSLINCGITELPKNNIKSSINNLDLTFNNIAFDEGVEDIIDTYKGISTLFIDRKKEQSLLNLYSFLPNKTKPFIAIRHVDNLVEEPVTLTSNKSFFTSDYMGKYMLKPPIEWDYKLVFEYPFIVQELMALDETGNAIRLFFNVILQNAGAKSIILEALIRNRMIRCLDKLLSTVNININKFNYAEGLYLFSFNSLYELVLSFLLLKCPSTGNYEILVVPYRINGLIFADSYKKVMDWVNRDIEMNSFVSQS